MRELHDRLEGIKVNAGPTTTDQEDAWMIGVLNTLDFLLGKNDYLIGRLIHHAEKIKTVHKPECTCGSCRALPVLRELQAK